MLTDGKKLIKEEINGLVNQNPLFKALLKTLIKKNIVSSQELKVAFVEEIFSKDDDESNQARN